MKFALLAYPAYCNSRDEGIKDDLNTNELRMSYTK